MHRKSLTAVIGLAALLLCSSAFAELRWYDNGGQGILDQVIQRYAVQAAAWANIITAAAERLFWSLGLISLVWTGGTLILRRADIGEFFAELFRFIMFLGFNLWLLRNGPAMALSIIESLKRLGEQASGVNGISPSGIVNVGFLIWYRAVTSLSAWSPIDGFVGAMLSSGILICLAVVAINMLLLTISAWLVAYAGVFILGFGGSRWTSDMAIHYFKTVLALGLQIMTMVLLVGIGSDLLTRFYGQMNAGALNAVELGIMFVVVLVLVGLVSKLPPMVGGIVSGASVGGGGIGNFGAGAVVGAAMSAASTAAGAAKLLGAAAASTGANALGAGSALKAAIQKAQSSIGESSSGGAMPRSQGSSDSSSSKSKGTGTAGDTPFAQAAGFSTVGSSSGGMLSTAKSSAGTDSAGGFNLPIGDAVSAETPAGGADASGGASSSGATGSSNSSASSATGSAGGADASGEAGTTGGSGSSSATASSGSGSASGGIEASGTAASGGGGGSPSGSDGKAQGRGRLATAGAIAAGTGAALAQGIADVAADKIEGVKEAGRKRIAATLGGQVASAIKRSGGATTGQDSGGPSLSSLDLAPTFEGNSLGGADDPAAPPGANTSPGTPTDSADPTSGVAATTGVAQRQFTDEQLAEIAAFVNKHERKDGTNQ